MPTTLADFMAKVEERNREGEDILRIANDEYAENESKFNNFEVTAQIMCLLFPELAPVYKPIHSAAGFMIKHMISTCKGVSIREPMSGRFTDLRNYWHLIEGLTDEMGEDKKTAEQEEIFRQQRRENALAVLDELYNNDALKGVDQSLVDRFWAVRANLIEGKV